MKTKIILIFLSVAVVASVGVAAIIKNKESKEELIKQQAQSLDITLEFDEEDYTLPEEDEVITDKEDENKSNTDLNYEDLEFDEDNYDLSETPQTPTVVIQPEEVEVNKDNEVVINISDGKNSTAIIPD